MASGGIDWRWLDAYRRAQRHGPLVSVELEVGCMNGLLPASYECCDRLCAQVWGRQRVLLMDPGQVPQLAHLHPTELLRFAFYFRQ